MGFEFRSLDLNVALKIVNPPLTTNKEDSKEAQDLKFVEEEEQNDESRKWKRPIEKVRL